MGLFDKKKKNEPIPRPGEPVEAKVVLQKCNKKDTFGVRIQKMNGDWYRTWAFKISEKNASDEGYDEEQISGSLDATEEYPGCPYCGDEFFVHCGACGKLSCSCTNVSNDLFVCPWCGNTGTLRTVNSFDISGGGY